MRSNIVALVVAALLCACVAGAADELLPVEAVSAMSETEVRDALVGKVSSFHAPSHGHRLTQLYCPDGRAFALGGIVPVHGTWRSSRNQICLQFGHPPVETCVAYFKGPRGTLYAGRPAPQTVRRVWAEDSAGADELCQ